MAQGFQKLVLCCRAGHLLPTCVSSSSSSEVQWQSRRKEQANSLGMQQKDRVDACVLSRGGSRACGGMGSRWRCTGALRWCQASAGVACVLYTCASNAAWRP
jgi:hypothetical protein